MDLQSGKLYWPTTFQNPPSYPAVEEDLTCDVLIIGGGSSGAQCAHYLSEMTDLSVVVVDKRKIGTGSTSTNTALIQYLGDMMLFELVDTFGEKAAIQHTKLCEDAINDIEKQCMSMEIDPEFIRRDTLYFASNKQGVKKLNKEHFYLDKHGFKADLLIEKQIRERYPFQKELALYTYDDGELNPFKYNHGLLKEADKKGVAIFEQTNITGKKLEKEKATFYTDNGHAIQARHVIIAAGYEGLEFKKEENAIITSSYAVVTNPVKEFTDWHRRTLIWETARPYLYMRTTKDNRIIIGGLDNSTTSPDKRDAKIMHNKDKLIEKFNKLFPNIHVSPEYYLGAFYGGTNDGLPQIGEYQDFPNCFFLFAYGDNGLVYSGVLAKILKDVIIKGSHPALSLYQKERA